ncbi:MAG: 1-acyl-sn-glycerol-3-phosphate acyltransferase [Stappiaceae bacterium]
MSSPDHSNLSSGFLALAPEEQATDLTAPHITDILIAERGQQIMSTRWWPLVRPLAHKVLHYQKARKMADDLSNLSAQAVFQYLSRRLNLAVTALNSERVPVNGSVVLVSNHPTGIGDGIALYDAIKARRRDLSIFANRDATRVAPRLDEMIIPVEWRSEFKSKSKTKETLRYSGKAFDDERAVVLFPSGRLAYWADGKLNERPWMTSAVALARRNSAPVIPVHISARNSGLFYFLARVSTELRDMTVFHELLNKKNQPFSVHFGHPIEPDALRGDLETVTKRLQAHCAVTLKDNLDARFDVNAELPAAP